MKVYCPISFFLPKVSCVGGLWIDPEVLSVVVWLDCLFSKRVSPCDQEVVTKSVSDLI